MWIHSETQDNATKLYYDLCRGKIDRNIYILSWESQYLINGNQSSECKDKITNAVFFKICIRLFRIMKLSSVCLYLHYTYNLVCKAILK